jgi:hypothetical protein
MNLRRYGHSLTTNPFIKTFPYEFFWAPCITPSRGIFPIVPAEEHKLVFQGVEKNKIHILVLIELC